MTSVKPSGVAGFQSAPGRITGSMRPPRVGERVGILGAITPTVRVSERDRPATKPSVERRRSGGRSRRLAGGGPARPGTRVGRSCRSIPRSPPAEIDALLDRLRPTHVVGPRDGDRRRSRAACPRRPAPRRSSSRAAPTGLPKGVELTRAGHGGDGPRLLRRARRGPGRSLARVPPAAPRREPRRARPLVRHRRAVHRARRASTSSASRASPRDRGHDDRLAGADRDAPAPRRGRAAARVPAS